MDKMILSLVSKYQVMGLFFEFLEVSCQHINGFIILFSERKWKIPLSNRE
jgi:hypothetical protein